MVSNFCADKKTISWPKQIKLAKQLIQKYPEISFWQSLELKDKIFCLSWFLTDKGIETLIIQERKAKLDLKVAATFLLQEGKIGEDLSLKAKPNTFFEFLNYGKTKS